MIKITDQKSPDNKQRINSNSSWARAKKLRTYYAAFNYLVLMIISWAIYPITYGAFNDVVDHINAEAIEYVRSQGIVKGYEDGTYQPNRTINRAEFIKIVIAAQFSPETIKGCDVSSFADVAGGQWFTNYICLAKEKGLIQGYPDKTFRPNQPITFVEAAKIIVNTFEASISTDTVWYKPFVEKLGEQKAIPESITEFSKKITRGEMAEMIYRLKAKVTNKPSKTYSALAGLSESAIENKEPPANLPPPAITYQGQILAGNQSPFLDFKQSDYEMALKTGKPIVLYFYANWCPLCQNELKSATYPAFNGLKNDRLTGFRVNFNDNNTDQDEEMLAREFGVAYQHTKVFLKNGDRILKSPETWDQAKYLEEFTQLLK